MQEEHYNKVYCNLIKIDPKSRSEWKEVDDTVSFLLGETMLPTESYSIWKNSTFQAFRGGRWVDLSPYLEASFELTRQNTLALLYYSDQPDKHSKPALKSIVSGDKDGGVVGAACLALSRFPEEIGYLQEMAFKLTKTAGKVGAFLGASEIMKDRGGSFYTEALRGGKKFPVTLQPLAFSVLNDYNARSDTRVISDYAMRIIGGDRSVPNALTDVVAYLYQHFDGLRTMAVFDKIDESWDSLGHMTQMYFKRQYDFFEDMQISDIPDANDLERLEKALSHYRIPEGSPIGRRWRRIQADILQHHSK